MLRRRVVLVLLAASLVPAVVRAKDEGCELTNVPRVVAVGDVHGSYGEFLAVLRLAGIIDQRDRWAGGKAHLVQTGDILDRGTETRPVMELLMRLEGEASKAGGRVHALLGNHEFMNVLGDLRYVSREEYKAFEVPSSRREWDRFYRSNSGAARQRAKAAKQAFDEAAFRRGFEEEAPLGWTGGHEHALQVIESQEWGRVLVSGAGSFGHTSHVEDVPGSVYRASRAGYMRIDFPLDGTRWLGVTLVSKDGSARESFAKLLE